MADAQKTIDLIFNGIDKTGAATMAALDNAKKFTGSVQNITAPIADFTAGAVKLEAGLLAAGLAMTVFAVKTAGDFDGAFREISTIIKASDSDLAGFKIAIDQYAAGSTQSMDEIMKALGAAVGSGVEWSKSLELIAVAEKLAVATRSDLGSTTKVLVSTLNSYGLELKDAGDLSDLFFSIIDKGDIKMSDLSDSFAKLAPVAKVGGVSLEEVGAAIATLTATGIKPAESMEYLRGAISNILSPSGQAKDLAAELGINFGAAGLKADGLSKLLANVSTATGGSAEKMKILFGDIGGFVAVATLAGPQAAAFAQNLIEMADRAGKSAKAFDIMKTSFENSTKIISNSFEYLLRQIGTPLLDEFGGIAEAIANIFKALGSSVKEGGMKELVTYIESVFGDIQDSLEAVAKNLPAALASADFSGFKGGIEAVIGAFKGLFGSIDLTSVDGLKTAIELVGTAFFGLSKYVAGVIEAFEPLFNKLIEVGQSAKDVNLDFLSMGGYIGGLATQVNFVLPLFNALLAILTIKSGLGLVSELKGLISVLPALATHLTTAGVALTAYFAADKVIDLVKALTQWSDANDHLAESQKESAAINEKAGISLERFAETTGIVAETLDEALALVDKGVVVWSTAANGYVKAGDALADVKDAAGEANQAVKQSNMTMDEARAVVDKAAAASDKLAKEQDKVATYALKTVPIIDQLTGKITGYEQQLVKTAGGAVKLGDATAKTGDELKRIATETAKAEEAQRKWNEELQKMQFQEKLKLIEAQTKITTAQIEADARKTVAAFESISTSIDSTGDVLISLFGLFKDFDKMGFSEQWKIFDQIEKENKLRQESFELQKKLTEAQIRLMRAQTKALENGDAMIKIDGAGLAPHLDAFMWEILRTIQVKVNKDGLMMLLGV